MRNPQFFKMLENLPALEKNQDPAMRTFKDYIESHAVNGVMTLQVPASEGNTIDEYAMATIMSLYPKAAEWLLGAAAVEFHRLTRVARDNYNNAVTARINPTSQTLANLHHGWQVDFGWPW